MPLLVVKFCKIVSGRWLTWWDIVVGAESIKRIWLHIVEWLILYWLRNIVVWLILYWLRNIVVVWLMYWLTVRGILCEIYIAVRNQYDLRI